MPSVLVNLVGGTDARARTTFSEGLVEVLHGKEQEQISPLRTLDEGVTGYQFELVALRSTLRKEHNQDPLDDDPEETEKLKNLLKASLGPLPTGKLRVTYGSSSPHEILNFIRDVGVDLFDVHWAQHAAEIGVALDFRFPAPNPSEVLWAQHPCPKPRSRTSHTIDVGHNLFSHDYAHDHSRLASSFLDGSCHSQLSATTNVDAPWCPCGACTPVPFTTSLTHDRLTQPPGKPTSTLPPYTRSYIHHLLHTHEMSSHTLLAMHNFFIMDAFFSGIRDVLHRSQTEAGLFEREVERFVATYEDPRRLFTETEKDWAKVESERGKGRLAREKAAQEESEAVVQDVEVV
ncbi:hypothetical protein EUX98_g7901 [Antrodiella citrinella]|uniref:tRNA-guanine(15) transglycosylase-like domain-containing protein n=1 Tax=Antrodiella citrinella TaxID=2447956 RepID=A0A4S4MF16_9APHY|nr:hypothetical protein EUX98_g7901 [Antrodiella citrinella]